MKLELASGQHLTNGLHSSLFIRARAIQPLNSDNRRRDSRKISARLRCWVSKLICDGGFSIFSWIAAEAPGVGSTAFFDLSSLTLELEFGNEDTTGAPPGRLATPGASMLAADSAILRSNADGPATVIAPLTSAAVFSLVACSIAGVAVFSFCSTAAGAGVRAVRALSAPGPACLNVAARVAAFGVDFGLSSVSGCELFSPLLAAVFSTGGANVDALDTEGLISVFKDALLGVTLASISTKVVPASFILDKPAMSGSGGVWAERPGTNAGLAVDDGSVILHLFWNHRCSDQKKVQYEKTRSTSSVPDSIFDNKQP
uniref:Uncharacterized protein n=1 Tax=Romanomermis culicivorax TaxID=13658 RepID=A0A915J748_ROMCU